MRGVTCVICIYALKINQSLTYNSVAGDFWGKLEVVILAKLFLYNSIGIGVVRVPKINTLIPCSYFKKKKSVKFDPIYFIVIKTRHLLRLFAKISFNIFYFKMFSILKWTRPGPQTINVELRPNPPGRKHARRIYFSTP